MNKSIIDPAVVTLDSSGRVVLSDEDLRVLEQFWKAPLAAGDTNTECNGRINAHCVNDSLCNDSINSSVCTNSGQCHRSGNQVCQNDVPP